MPDRSLRLLLVAALVLAAACDPGPVRPPDSGSGRVDGGSPDGGPPALMCDDGARNGDETATDCGGSCPPCANGSACGTGEDCESGVCSRGFCLAPTCEDGVRNGDETGTDCGGSCGLCPGGEPCTSNTECLSGRCGAGGVCAASSCEDGVLNADETDVDCGGPMCAACPPESACVMASDCASMLCISGVCAAPTCSDGVQNQDETSRDCGGAVCAACADGLACTIDSDCVSSRCWMGGCVSCTDGILSGDESDVDCGGIVCDACPDGDMCVVDADCENTTCEGSLCVSCVDGTLNQDESDVDCGGTACAGCDTGDACGSAADCASTICDAATMTCNAPGCGDGTQNGAETDVDCGGGTCIGCAAGLTCGAPADCLSGVCSGGTCATPSCTDGVQNGGESDVDCGGATSCDRCPDLDRCTDPSDCITGACTSGYCGTMPCGPTFLRINELHGGDGPGFDFIEIINTSGCTLDIGGVEVATLHNCSSTTPDRYTFPAGTMLAPGGIARLRDTTGTLMAGEYYAGAICWDAGTVGWTAVCDGPCDLGTCANFLDYQEQNDVAGRPPTAPSCATFTPAPLDVSSISYSTAGESVHRVAFSGSGSAGVASDWAISMYTR